MGDYINYDRLRNFDDSVYDQTQNQLNREFSPRGEPFDLVNLAAYLNFNLLNDRIMDREPTIFDKLMNGDQDQELEEEYETDPSENIITFFRLSFPQRDPFSTTTEQPIEIEGSDQPQLFTIIRFTYNPDTQDYDSAESQSDYGIRGSFDEDKQASNFDLSSQWNTDGFIMNEYKNRDEIYDYIGDETDLMIGHFPLHYILVCLGFSLMIALLFMTRRRQIARQRHMAARMAVPPMTDVKIVIGGEAVKIDAPPAYDDAIKMPAEKENDQMLPKYEQKK